MIHGVLLTSIEKNLLISLLKLTENGPIRQESVIIDAKLPTSVASILLKKLQKEELVYLKNSLIEIDSPSRLKLAVKAVELGADVENISDLLQWQEFEAMAALALEQNGYETLKNVRFKNDGKRWEIDVVGCRKPIVVGIDCKHWHHGMHFSTLKKAATAQAERVAAFAESIPNKSINLPCVNWGKAKFVPVIVSLIQFGSNFCNDVPIVPVLKLRDFICQLPLQVDSLRYFEKRFTQL
jgi:Holliday junction resolvase-like predicted endonuclease